MFTTVLNYILASEMSVGGKSDDNQNYGNLINIFVVCATEFLLDVTMIVMIATTLSKQSQAWSEEFTSITLYVIS